MNQLWWCFHSKVCCNITECNRKGNSLERANGIMNTPWCRWRGQTWSWRPLLFHYVFLVHLFVQSKGKGRNFSGSPVVKTWSSNAEGGGSIPSPAAKIPHAEWPKNQKINKKGNMITDSKKIFKMVHKRARTHTHTHKSKTKRERYFSKKKAYIRDPTRREILRSFFGDRCRFKKLAYAILGTGKPWICRAGHRRELIFSLENAVLGAGWQPANLGRSPLLKSWGRFPSSQGTRRFCSKAFTWLDEGNCPLAVSPLFFTLCDLDEVGTKWYCCPNLKEHTLRRAGEKFCLQMTQAVQTTKRVRRRECRKQLSPGYWAGHR